jgi:hypothetical protein
MMKPITMLLLFLAFAAGVSAQTKNPEELDQIKAEYQAQVKSTLDPINRKYLQQLDALKKQLGGKGDLDSALKVQKHIEEFSAKANMAPPGSKLYVPRNETVKQVNAPNPTLNAISEDDAIVFKDVGLPKAPNADSVQPINLDIDAKVKPKEDKSSLRSSGDIPRDGLRLWLRADGDMIKDNEGRVSLWRDQSGNKFDVQQKEKSKQPVFVNGVEGSAIALRFDGADDYLETENDIDLMAAKKDNTVSTVYTVIVVVNPDNRQREYADILDYQHDAWTSFALQQEGNNLNVFSAGEQLGQHLEVGVFQIYMSRRDQQMGWSLLNGGSRKQSPQPLMKSTEPRWLTVGSKSREAYPRNFKGQIAEILLYNRPLNDMERQNVEKYLARKYFINICASEIEDAKNLSIGGLTADRLTECRRFASGRPRPENYDFTQDAFNAYVTSIPQDNRIAEEERFKMVSGIKNYIVRLMERKTYDKPIKLKNGSTVSGGLMVNSNYISVKGKGNTFDRQGWNSIPVDQVANILDYFADLKLKASEDVNVSKSQQKLEAAEDYLRIGILCDWYGDYESAVKFARKAVATEPKIEESVKKYMMQ